MGKNSLTNKALAMYEYGRKNLITFREVFLPGEDDIQSPQFHYDWSDILLHGKKHFAIEGYRESAKSQIVLRANTLYRLVYPSNNYDYIMLIMNNQENASKKLKEIAREYQDNPILSLNLVEVVQDSEKAFEVKVKNLFDLDDNGQPKIINVRIEAHGKGSGGIRGASHYSKRPKLVIIDDPQDKEDSMSDTVLEYDWQWFTSDIVFLGKKTRIFMIGNNLGARCLIERIFKEKAHFGFETKKIPVMYKDEENNWVSSWPEQSSVEEIIAERESFKKIGQLDSWYQNKMCEAISPEKKTFTSSMFKYAPQMPRGSINYYITSDLAISKNTGADYSAFVIVGVNSSNHWFIPEIVFGRFDPTEIIDTLFYLQAKYQPITVGIEVVAFQASIKHFLEKEQIKRNIFFNITELRAEKKKELRIATLQPRFSAGGIWFVWNENTDKPEWLIEIESELESFTPTGMKTGLHDDLIDALAYQEQIALAPSDWGINDEDMPLAGSM